MGIMYCKHCGKQIADDSKFCQHCGGKQDAVIDSHKKSQSAIGEKPKGAIELPTILVNVATKTKWLLFGYVIWFVFNLYWLFAGDKSGYAVKYFQPFADVPFEDESYYDISEFIIYVVGIPLAIWGIMLLGKHFKEKCPTQSKFLKSYGIAIMLGLLLFVVLIVATISIHSDDDNDYYQNNYQSDNRQSQQREDMEDSYTEKSIYEQDFNSKMSDLKGQIENIGEQIQNSQINSLPSSKDNYFSYDLDKYFP